MPVDYAEPTQLQNFKVEVFQPGSDTPTLTKPTNSPTYKTAPDQLTVPNRDTSLGKPNNLPSRQDSLRNDGQYRTVDVTPTNTAKSPSIKQLNQLGNGTAGEAAIAEAAYYAGFLIDGVIDGLQSKNFENDSLRLKRTVLEDLSYKTGNMAGKEARDLTEDAIKSSEKLLDDLWRNKPTFEIPQVKIPKFDLPKLPNLEPPKFPEFKFPEISFPKPQPVNFPTPQPKTSSLTEQLKRLDMFDCGGATMKISYVALLTQRIRSTPTGSIEEIVFSQSDIKTFIAALVKEDPNSANLTTSQILEGAGQSGANYRVDEGNIKFRAFRFIPTEASGGGDDGYYQGVKYHSFPFYRATTLTIDISKGGSIRKILAVLNAFRHQRF